MDRFTLLQYAVNTKSHSLHHTQPQTYFNLDLLFSYGCSVASTFNNRADPFPGDIPKAGWMYGADFGAKIIFLPTKRFHPTASLTYTSLKVLYTRYYFDNNGNAYPGVENLHGANIAVGVSMEI